METQSRSIAPSQLADLESRLLAAVQVINIDLATTGARLSLTRGPENGDGPFIVCLEDASFAPTERRFVSLSLVEGKLEGRLHSAAHAKAVVLDPLQIGEATPDRMYERMAGLAEALANY